MRLLLAAVVLGVTACGSVVPSPRACTEMACNDGLRVEFVFRDRGEYVFDVVIDGQTTTCRATLPLADPPPMPCDRDGVFLGLSGSKLPADQHSINGLMIASKTTQHLTVRVRRDGAQIAALDRDVTYTVTPGPNGPECEPKECRSATLTF